MQALITSELESAARAHDAGKFGDALLHFRRAAALDPASLPVIGSIGLVLLDANSEEADRWCGTAVHLDPYSIPALHNLALATKRRNNSGRTLRRLVAIAPSHEEGGRLLAAIDVSRGDLHAGDARLSRALCSAPLSAAVLVDAAENARRLGRRRRSETALQAATALAPANVGVLNASGVQAQKSTDGDRAIQLYRRGLAVNDRHPALWSNVGMAFMRRGLVGQAASGFRRSIALNPPGADAMAGLAFAEGVKRREERSLRLCRRSMVLEPAAAAARALCASIERTRGRLSEAATHCRLALVSQPDDATTHMVLGATYQEMRKLQAAMAAFGRALAGQAGFVDAERNHLYALLHLPGVSEERVFRSTVLFAKRHQPAEEDSLPEPANEADGERRLRIGYVSSDFRDHPNRWFMNALFEYRDRQSLSVVCYSASYQKDRETEWVRSKVDAWREVVEMSDREIAEAMRADGIDVAVFIGGRFDGNRPLVAAYRAAPVQISYLDGGTSGIRHMDYWITDGTLHPEGETRELFSEELFRLPVFYSFTRPMPDVPVVTPPVLREGRITFGSFTQPARITDEVISVWAEILHAVPESRVLLKSRNRYGDRSNRHFLEEAFGEHGISRDRVLLGTTTDSHSAHLAQYGRVDVALDTFPFNAATTNFEALWMGVPIVTLPGTRFVARMGAAILTSAGYPELVATSRNHYIDIAVGLARDVARLADLRSGLRERLRSSPLCDGPAYARSMEAAYRSMWRRWCRQQAVEAPRQSRS